MDYDVLIVGGGISGMYAARELLKRNPSWSIAIAEKYMALGGRISTFHKGPYQWEEGAGRIPDSHPLIMKLIKEYGCTWVPIHSGSLFKPSNNAPAYKNPFESLYIPRFLQPLERLDKHTLATHTLEQLLQKLYGNQHTKEILDTFPYVSETKILRADMALATFIRGEMSANQRFGIVKEGLSELIHRLQEDIVKRGCKLLFGHALEDIRHVQDAPNQTECHFSIKSGTTDIRATRACILTLCRCHVAALPFLKDVPVLKHVIGKSLFRVYMVFPTKNKRSWFSDLPSVVTSERIRYFIPINSAKGICMASYTDAMDTEYYHTIFKLRGEKGLENAVLKDLRALFQNDIGDIKDIPNPRFTKGHYWGTGASYWLPGNYNPETISKEALKPRKDFPGLYMCGESWSLRQAWIEGALEHTTECLALLR